MSNNKSTSINFSTTGLLIIIVGNLVLDQLSKFVVRRYLPEHEQINIIKNHFVLMKVENDGAFLSWGSAMPDGIKAVLLNILPVIVLIYGLWLVFKNKQMPRFTQAAVCCFIGGGVGNVFDRMMYGSVTDFMFMDFYLFKTGIFNLADLSIMTGLGLLLYQSFWIERRSQKELEVNDKEGL